MWELTANIDVLLYVLLTVVIIISVLLIFTSQRGKKRGRGSDGGGRVGVYDGECKGVGQRGIAQSAGREKTERKSNGLGANGRNTGDIRLSAAAHNNTAYDGMTDYDREGKMPAMIALALGGAENIKAVSCSDTRLRVKVDSGKLVDKAKLIATGALGILAKNCQVQVFYEDSPVRLCRELAAYVKKHRSSDAVDMEETIEYERVLEKIFAPVEGDIVRLSDIYHVQDMGDGGIGGFAVCAKRGEIRAPFDCKAGYSEAGGGTLECRTESGICASVALMHSEALRLHFVDGEKVRKGRLLAEFFPEESKGVYCMVVVTVSSSAPAKLIVHPGEDVNYEYVAGEVVG